MDDSTGPQVGKRVFSGTSSRVEAMGMELTRVEPLDAETADEVEQLISATFAVTARAANIEPSVREILQQAGLSTKAFYRHFRSKDELLLVALEQGSRRIAEYLQHRMAAQPEPMARIGAWIEGLVRQAMDPEAARKTLPWSLGFGRLALLFPEEFKRTQALLISPLERQIRLATKSGALHSPDPARDAWVIFGYTVDTTRYHLIQDTTPSAATLQHLIDFASRALGAEPPSGAG